MDGFRYDAVTAFYEDRELRDNPAVDKGRTRDAPDAGPNPFTWQEHQFDMLPSDCASFTHDLRGWAGRASYLIGEINRPSDSVELALQFAQEGRLDAGYTTDLADRGLNCAALADMIERGAAKDGRLVWWLLSHDQPRAVSRHGDGSPQDARLLATLLFALPGPTLVLQGEELGQLQAELRQDQLVDPFDRAFWPNPPGRDGARTPIAWDRSDGFGFSSVRPWLPVAPQPGGTVAEQVDDPASVLGFWRKAHALRRQLALSTAEIEVIEARDDWFLARLTRRDDGGVVILAMNLSNQDVSLPIFCGNGPPCLSSLPLKTGCTTLPARAAGWWQA